MNTRNRLALLTLMTALLVAVAVPGRVNAQQAPAEIHIGYQTGGIWSYLKAQGILEKHFGSSIKVTWALFPAGPQLLEALNAGAIDIGSTGETPPIFAQAAGTPLKYVAVVSGNGAGQAILVPENSPLKTVNDLKGKKVAFNKASAAHLMLVKALRKFNLDYNDITPVFLSPPDARAAFQGGSIDAWVIWDPFRAAAIKELNARALVEGQNVSPTKSYIEASQNFVANHADVVRAVIEQVQNATVWERAHIDDYSAIVAKETGLTVEIIKFALQTEIPDYLWIDDSAIAYQQSVADIFYDLKLIPDQLTIKDVIWIGGTNPPPATASATLAATSAATLVATAAQ